LVVLTRRRIRVGILYLRADTHEIIVIQLLHQVDSQRDPFDGDPRSGSPVWQGFNRELLENLLGSLRCPISIILPMVMGDTKVLQGYRKR
jgi:hypothetical protein